MDFSHKLLRCNYNNNYLVDHVKIRSFSINIPRDRKYNDQDNYSTLDKERDGDRLLISCRKRKTNRPATMHQENVSLGVRERKKK